MKTQEDASTYLITRVEVVVDIGEGDELVAGRVTLGGAPTQRAVCLY